MTKRRANEARASSAHQTKTHAVSALSGGRPIRWDEWDLSRLDDDGRVKVGKSWSARMKQEHLAVGAFSMLATELAAEGCDPVVLSLVTRASCDEVRHTEICRKMAVGLLGEGKVPQRFRGVPSIPKHVDASVETRNLCHLVEMCCLSETFTGVFLTEMLGRIPAGKAGGTPRMAVESLLEDEIDHGRVGWAFLASRAQEKNVAGLAESLPAMLDRTMGWVMDWSRSNPEDDRPELEAVGYLGSTTSEAIFRSTLKDVILPGFARCGIDTRPVEAHARAKGWMEASLTSAG
jgi:hypothetical protein